MRPAMDRRANQDTLGCTHIPSQTVYSIRVVA